MVVFGHAQHHTFVQTLKLGGSFERVHLLPWRAGVDIFFVISGFIMVYASEDLFGRKGASVEFLARRVARIVPLYWMFTAFYTLFLVIALVGTTKDFPGWPNIVASFAFWPAYATGHEAPMPVFELGWTLNYEMFFYAVFAVFIGLRRSRTVIAVAALLGGLVLMGFVLQPSAAAPFFWTRPIILEFVFGMGIALLLRHGVVLSGLIRGAFLVSGVAILIADPDRLVASGHRLDDAQRRLARPRLGTPRSFDRLRSRPRPSGAAFPSLQARGPSGRRIVCALSEPSFRDRRDPQGHAMGRLR